jgi:hypothetical protein
VEYCLEVGDDFFNGFIGNNIYIGDKGSLIGTIKRNDQFLPAKLSGLDCHGQYSVEPDKGSGDQYISSAFSSLLVVQPYNQSLLYKSLVYTLSHTS